MNVGKRIKEERLKLGFTQKEVAERCGLSVSYISDIEVGRTNPSLKTLESISKALKLEMKSLL